MEFSISSHVRRIAALIVFTLLFLRSAKGGLITAGYMALDASVEFDSSIDLPAGFFGSWNGVLSDPVHTGMLLTGLPVGSLPGPASNYSIRGTFFHHPDFFLFLNPSLGTPSAIVYTSGQSSPNTDFQVQLIALAVQSISPLMVTYGGANPTPFLLTLGLDSSVTAPLVLMYNPGSNQFDPGGNHIGFTGAFTGPQGQSFGYSAGFDAWHGGAVLQSPEPGSFPLAASVFACVAVAMAWRRRCG